MATKAKAPAKAPRVSETPAEWVDDVQLVKAHSSDDGTAHVLDRSCWCNPRLVSLPAIVDGVPGYQTQVRHRSNTLERSPSI